jgi:Zn-finger nucleic acid-binding protein
LENEPVRKCPVDGSDMDKKRVLDKFLIDWCPRCEGIWFDKGELKAVQLAAKEAGTNETLANVGVFLAII